MWLFTLAYHGFVDLRHAPGDSRQTPGRRFTVADLVLCEHVEIERYFLVGASTGRSAGSIPSARKVETAGDASTVQRQASGVQWVLLVTAYYLCA